jgi:hypothetical protein
LSPYEQQPQPAPISPRAAANNRIAKRILIAIVVVFVALVFIGRSARQDSAQQQEVIAESMPPSAAAEAGYVSREEYGAAWPLTVDSGVLTCDQSESAFGAILFSADGRKYGVNGRAKSLGHPPIDPIWRTTTHRLDYPALTRLPEEQRQRIFASVVACEEAGSGDAHEDACRKQARDRYKLTAAELTRVTSEGVSLSWPPLTPMRVNIEPLLKRGIALCQR